MERRTARPHAADWADGRIVSLLGAVGTSHTPRYEDLFAAASRLYLIQ